uniref:Chromo domain-containing protein n=1 Tax=Globodera pallida TaxID=36090 RepID=A0A183C0B5_GLOPA
MMRNPISRAVKLYRSDILECHGARAIAPIRKPIDQKGEWFDLSRAAFITFRNFQSKKKPTPKGASPALVGCMESTLSDNGKSFRQQHKSTFLRKSRAAFITFRKLQTNNRTMQCCDIEWCAITLPLDNAKAQLFYNQCICLIVKHKIRMDELPDVLNPQPIAVDEEESYIVSEIFDDRIDADGTILYAVRWEQDQSTTWEPINNLEGAHETLEEYLLGKNSKAQDTKKTGPYFRKLKAYEKFIF